MQQRIADAAQQPEAAIPPSVLGITSFRHGFTMALPPPPAPVGFTAIGPAGKGLVTFQAPAGSQPAAALTQQARIYHNDQVRPLHSGHRSFVIVLSSG